MGITKNYVIKATLSVIPAPYRVRGKLQPVSSDVAFKVASMLKSKTFPSLLRSMLQRIYSKHSSNPIFYEQTAFIN